jgi:hypothetical protein
VSGFATLEDPVSTPPDKHLMPGLAPEEAALAQQADEVRAWFVSLRGGAPFLSSEDGRLLLSWLDGGMGVLALQACIERVADRRRKRKLRGRLTLAGCRGEVRKARKAGATEPALASASSGGAGDLSGLAALGAELRCQELAPGPAKAMGSLASALERIAEEGEDVDSAARAATAACRSFHEAVWGGLGDERAQVEATVRAEMMVMEAALGAAGFAELVGELARTRVRSRFPLVSAQELWDRLGGNP